MLGLARFVTHGSGGSGPSLNFNFADNSPYLSQQITFTRASAGTFVGSNGLIQNAPVNLFLQSQTFATTWSKTGCNVTDNSVTSPDGTVNATTVATTSTVDSITQDVAVTSGVTYTFSGFLKAGTSTSVALLFLNTNSAFATTQVNFNLVAGTASVATGTPVSYSITAQGNGWYRCVVTQTALATVAGSLRFASTSPDAVSSYYMWGAQLVEGSVAGPYARTVASTSGAPRFDYDPVTLAAKGLLIEEQRTNLLTRSEDFGNATWSKTTCTVSTDATTSPAGDSTADKLIPDVGVTTYNIIQGLISKSAVATTYTYTIYVKDGGFQSFTLYINDNATTANRVQASFNISTVTTSSVSAAGTFTAASASLAAVGNGWYRCVLTGTSSTETSIQVRLLHGTGTGDGTSGLFIWGAQLEAGSFATSYIPTVASQVTRSTDVASVNTLSPWYNETEGTLFAEWSQYAIPVVTTRVATIDSGTTANILQVQSAGVNRTGALSVASVGVFAYATSPITVNAVNKIGIATKSGDSSVAVGGVTLGTSTATYTPPAMTTLRIGSNIAAGQPVNGHIRRITYYPRRLPNATLQQITS